MTEPATDPAVRGLTGAEVAERVADGRVNVADDSASRSLRDIVRANVFTLFNAMLGIALVCVLVTGYWQDALFGFVLVLNMGIGIVTEYRAKRTLDRLAILDAPHARVRRDGVEHRVDLPEIVLDDVVLLSTGDQVPVDGAVLGSGGLEVDESLLTGESEPVRKAAGDEVLSGSSVVAGSAVVRATKVGPDSYANRITAQARRYSLATSELQQGIRTVLRVISWVIVPVAVALFASQVRSRGGLDTVLSTGTWRDAVVSAVAGVVGMIPDGLVLLTSLNFALAAVLLARVNVLVQELPAVEVLARVDTLCLDKTGTITDGAIVLDRIVDVGDRAGATAALSALAHDPEANVTAAALAEGLDGVVPAEVLDAVPFSSARKWSAIATADGAWVFGAPDVLLAGRTDDDARAALAAVGDDAGAGARVLLLAAAPDGLPDADAALPAALAPQRVAVLREHVRPDAAETLAYFRDQDVALRVISGDNPATVAAIATQVDLDGQAREVSGVDARGLPDDVDALAGVLRESAVFGRVVPEQKVAIVEALQHDGRTVAMTGDGVNDALALKNADLGIAMGNGARATKAVARIVLLDGKFQTLPRVVAQGRRVIANMERVANFFLVKTTYSAVIAVVVVLLALLTPFSYPFLPRHLTLASSLTIGIPAFLLSLPPNDQRYRPGFLRRVLSFAIPSGVVVAIAVLVAYALVDGDGNQAEARTAATYVTIAIGLWIVGIFARPWNVWRVLLVLGLAAAGIGALLVPLARDFFLLVPPTPTAWAIVGGLGVLGACAVELVHRWAHRVADRPA
ncbi:ATPase, P-type (transporting), HAD superfamily, subfamily IC [Beutenbergia cavernae DSM 12333]|uniref:ATPase, P-type (Transporting), HAD superfamily, subfamily IC n=1 Tax=Beutenbergia cavernae (strain ATCC BAA-8 / DSM 12333 / CCUG 43141 / JCM 11478 / NBRC 16432 / NCIMB 13614 / HKI 0122) TaxID=471853 RepID=C5C5K9_BEUC1|nr:HAD-IC family P-type ATPase [Beutenbergia cavernae]ACQ80200.1 ATPase, P-type (transporting), HAD superfamily, subfamily IC [Beutenbergia cavernae DSM 12333]